MKKILLGFMILVAILVIVACTPPHSHTVTSELIVVKEATCDEDGTAYMFCTSCGEIVNTVTIDKVSHNFGDWETIEEATKTEDGSAKSCCTICGKCETIVLPYTGSKGLEYTLNSNNTSYTVSSIGSCTDLDVVIPKVYNGLPVTSIGDLAFAECAFLISIEIPDSVISIGSGAFYYCTSLASITIPDSVTNIGESAFRHCTSLTDIEIPNSVKNIGSFAFLECTSLKYNEYNNALYLGNKIIPYVVLIKAKDTSITSCEIHSETKFLSALAFSNCNSLTSIKIPNSIISIPSGAFFDCSALTSIEIPDSVTHIGEHAFSFCSSLISVEIPNSVTSIGLGAFYDTSLITVEIPASVRSIGNGAFAFSHALTTIEVDENNAYYKSIDGNLYSKNGKDLIQYAIGKQDKSFVIPDFVTRIGGVAFFDCSALTSIEIPDSVNNIDIEAFKGCESLSSITFKGTVERWNTIKKGEYWNDYILATEVVCSDGTVSLQ